MKAQAKIDEFAFVLLAGLILIIILMIAWGTPTEAPPFVQPTSISLTIPRNMSSTFNLNITGGLSNVTLSATGGIGNWISFSKSNFDVSGSTSVRVKVKVPNVATGTYNGRIIVKSVGGQQSVSVNVLVAEQQVEELSRLIKELGDFSVIYTAGTETLDSKEDIEVSGGYLSTHSKNLVGVLTEKKLEMVEDGYIQLIVDETNNAGNLIVSFNDKDVFNENVGAGEILVPIEKSLIKRSNTVKISAGMPGWMFWMSTVYRIRSASFVVNYEGILSKDFPFSLDDNEITNFARFQLSGKINCTPSRPEMQIKINNQIVYSERPPLTWITPTFDRDILGNSLSLSPENTISFSFDTEASCKISAANLYVYYFTTRLD